MTDMAANPQWIAQNIVWIILVSLGALIILPGVGYILWGRRYRRQMILNYFTPNAIAQYYDQFMAGNSEYGELARNYRFQCHCNPQSDETCNAANRLSASLLELYNKRFGWAAYLIPLIILMAVLAEDGALVAKFASAGLGEIINTETPAAAAPADPAAQTMSITVAAIAGAYMWVGLSMISRCASLTLLPWDINYYSLRLLISPMMGHAAAVLDKDRGILIAFVITLLPIGDIMSWLRAGAAKALNITESPRETEKKVINLPGVDSQIAARLEEQGVTTIRQLVDADPVQLSMRTGLDFTFVVTLVDEAIAWGYFGPTLLSLSSFGWIGASSIIDTSGTLAGDAEQAAVAFSVIHAKLADARALVEKTPETDTKRPKYEADRAAIQLEYDASSKTLLAVRIPLIREIAKVNELKLSPEGLHNAVQAIGNDSYAMFIRNLLREIQAAAAARATAQATPTGTVGRVMSSFAEAMRRLAKA